MTTFVFSFWIVSFLVGTWNTLRIRELTVGILLGQCRFRHRVFAETRIHGSTIVGHFCARLAGECRSDAVRVWPGEVTVTTATQPSGCGQFVFSRCRNVFVCVSHGQENGIRLG
uniref:Putative secreted peptide n=1 Tax=Anopheles braziliensis TaxID=58242 RepID=A0A2M3ZPB2_9DIPT